MSMSGPPPLFDRDTVRLLQRLHLHAQPFRARGVEGRWRAGRGGSSVEFADYRTYAAGDDFRRIDWNAYARLERLFVRLYSAEEDIAVRLYIDTSASMAWGHGHKARLAAQLAGALTFVALRHGDRVSLHTCRADRVPSRDGLDHLQGEAAVATAWRWLAQLDCGGATDLNRSLAAAARHVTGPGWAIVVTDLLSPTGYRRGLDALLDRGQRLVLIHVVAPEEVKPPADMVGDWRLIDAEPDASIQATITPAVLTAYRRLVERFIAEAQDVCRRRGATYVLVSSGLDLKDVLTGTLRQAGVLT